MSSELPLSDAPELPSEIQTVSALHADLLVALTETVGESVRVRGHLFMIPQAPRGHKAKGPRMFVHYGP